MWRLPDLLAQLAGVIAYRLSSATPISSSTRPSCSVPPSHNRTILGRTPLHAMLQVSVIRQKLYSLTWGALLFEHRSR